MRKVYHRTATILILGLILGGGLLGYSLYKTNKFGFSGRWTVYVEEALAMQGVRAEVESFRYSFTEGLTSRGITIYDPSEPEQQLARFGKVTLEVGHKEASKAQFLLKSITIQQGEAWINVQNETQDRIHITDINCTIDLSRPYDLSIENCRANIYGVPVTVSGISHGATRPRDTDKKKDLNLELPIVVTEILRHLYEIGTTSVTGPAVTIEFTHEAEEENGLELSVAVQGDRFSYKSLNFNRIDAGLHYQNSTLSFTHLECADDTGALSFSGNYHTQKKQGEFTVASTTNLPKILRVLSITPLTKIANRLISPLPPKLQAQGTFSGKSNAEGTTDWQTHIYGDITLEEFRLLGTVFDAMETEFSWKDGRLFLRNMSVRHEEGEVYGRVLLSDQSIRYEARSTLPPKLYSPFIKEDGIIADNIAKTRYTDQSAIEINVQGSMMREQLDEWEATGTIALTNIEYDDVPLEQASCDFTINPVETSFRDIAARFNYARYIPSAYAQNQPSSGEVRAQQVSYSPKTKLLELNGLSARAWIGPVLNLFSKEIGSTVDNIAYFTAPPHLSGGGTIGLDEASDQTKLLFSLITPSDIYYTLLGKDVRLNQTRGIIRLVGSDIYLDNIQTRALSGKIVGNFRIGMESPHQPNGLLEANVSFSNLSLLDVSERYEFVSEKTVGTLTGRTSIKCVPGQIRTLQGEGFIGLDQADLYDIPIFGPLSKLLQNLSGDKNRGHEQVKSVSAGFQIRDGKVLTNDIVSTTHSTVINGNGEIDLNTQELDITVRAKTKGLLGLLTLPLKPLEKLIQFRGKGPISEPVWSNAAFDPTPDQLPAAQPNRAIMIIDPQSPQAPERAIIVEE